MRAVRGLIAACIGVFSLAGVLVLAAPPAGANVSGPCGGSATINGNVYTPANDTPGNPVKVPDSGLARYHGDTKTVTGPEHGHLAVVVGQVEITVYSWASDNSSHRLADDGQENLSTAYNKLPIGIAGLYKLKGYHYNGSTLYCSGFAYVKFTRSPLSTPIGVAGVVGTAVGALGLAIAAFGRRFPA